jgi:hypothetical protein
MIRRREFIAGLGGSAAWSIAAGAQQGDRVRRIGVVMTGDENDPEGNRRLSAFTKRLPTWVGPMAATYVWTFVGAATTSIGYERSRNSWSACNSTSS